MYRDDKNDYFWDMCFNKRPDVELYDVKKDPFCLNNLAYENSFQKRLLEMEDFMTLKLREQNDPRMSGNGQVFDKYPYAGKVKNFYNRYINGEKVEADWVNKTDFPE